mgnify:CR=1 FL=1
MTKAPLSGDDQRGLGCRALPGACHQCRRRGQSSQSQFSSDCWHSSHRQQSHPQSCPLLQWQRHMPSPHDRSSS